MLSHLAHFLHSYYNVLHTQLKVYEIVLLHTQYLFYKDTVYNEPYDSNWYVILVRRSIFNFLDFFLGPFA